MAQEAILEKVNGEVHISKSFDFMCSQLRNGRYRVKIERFTEPRTLSQNALMWLWFTCIEQETGTDKQGMYTITIVTAFSEGLRISEEKKWSLPEAHRNSIQCR